MVSERKKRMAEKIKSFIRSYRTIFVFDLHSIPASQLHKIRELLKDVAKIFVVKKRVLQKVMEEEKLTLPLEGIKMPALIFSDRSVFDVVKKLRLYKLPMKAKPGDKAPKDIVIKKGVTQVPAGPAIATFKAFKMPTFVKDGKIAIKEDFKLCNAGEVINENMVSLLNLLGIEPLEIGIRPKCAYSENVVYDEFVLSLEEDWFREHIKSSVSNALNLATNIKIPTKQNISLLLAEGYMNAKNLGLYLGIPSKETISELLVKASNNAKALERSFRN